MNPLQILDVHPLKSRVGDFVAALKSLESHPITTARVSEVMAQIPLSPEALKAYVLWNRERYTRNLIYRDDFFEVIALCWLPGQRTPIHSHNGQLGWVTIVQGELICRNYRFVRSQSGSDPLIPCTANAQLRRPVEVELLSTAACHADGRVAVVDRSHTTHQIENLEKSARGSVSLHVYSKPINSCVLFDDASRCCERRQLQYFSVNGVVLQHPPQTGKPSTIKAG